MLKYVPLALGWINMKTELFDKYLYTHFLFGLQTNNTLKVLQWIYAIVIVTLVMNRRWTSYMLFTAILLVHEKLSPFLFIQIFNAGGQQTH